MSLRFLRILVPCLLVPLPWTILIVSPALSVAQETRSDEELSPSVKSQVDSETPPSAKQEGRDPKGDAKAESSGGGEGANGGTTGPDASNPLKKDENVPPLWQLLLVGVIGGAMPDLLRVLKWSQTAADSRGVAPYKDFGFWISLVIHIALGPAAVWIFGPTTLTQAVAFGYSGPELLSKGVDSATGGANADRAAGRPSSWNQLKVWWSH